MKKQIIILLVALFLLIFCGLWEINYLENTSRYLHGDINSVKNLVENENFEMAKKQYESIENTWNNISSVWNIFVNHERLDYLEEEMTLLKSNLEVKQKEEALNSIDKLERIVTQIVEKQKPTFEHIL